MPLNAEQIRAEVRRFWQVFEAKQADALADFYAHESTVFGSASTRPEPGRLAAARRQREYFHRQATVKAEAGVIDVVLLGDTAAVASYGFKFRATGVAGALGKQEDEDITSGRATQVFALDPDGKLRIVHEHLSLPYRNG